MHAWFRLGWIGLGIAAAACDSPSEVPSAPQQLSSITRPAPESLAIAIRDGSRAAVADLLDRGADPNALDATGQPALHVFFAGSNWRLEPAVLDLLLARGADPNGRDLHERTPLHAAAERGRPELVARLLRAGAQVDRVDDQGQTPLHRAVALRHKRIVAQLLKELASPNAADLQARTPLHLATEQNDWSIGTELIWAGADPLREDQWGHRPLAWAAAGCLESLSSRLKARGPRSGPDCLRLRKILPAVLHLAAARGETAVVAQLLNARVDASQRFAFLDSEGAAGSALHAAAAAGQLEVVQLLLARGLDPDARDANGWTPLHRAVWRCQAAVVQVLLNAKADPNARTRSGQTARDLAAGQGNKEVEALLLGR